MKTLDKQDIEILCFEITKRQSQNKYYTLKNICIIEGIDYIENM